MRAAAAIPGDALGLGAIAADGVLLPLPTLSGGKGRVEATGGIIRVVAFDGCVAGTLLTSALRCVVKEAPGLVLTRGDGLEAGCSTTPPACL